MEPENIRTEQADKKINAGCPMCGGAMEFDPATGGLYCPFCEYRCAVPEKADEQVMEQAFNAAASRESFSWGAQQKQIICNSCGAQAVYDSLQTSAVCPFCGSNNVMEEAVDTSLPPNGLCPFTVTRDKAGANFSRWLKGKLFTPSKAKKSVRPEMFTGMYIPYWTFDSQTSSFYTAKYGIDRTYTDSKGNSHTTTDWYSTQGNYSLFIDDALAYGTTRHNQNTLKQIEPYDTHRAVPYDPSYLSGFLSERYSIGLQDAWKIGKKRMDDVIKAQIESLVQKQHNADHVNLQKCQTMYNDLTYKYVLLPLWQSSYTYKEKRFDFMVNGQTGKVGGKAPVSALRVTIAILLALAVIVLLVVLSNGCDSDATYYMSAADTLPFDEVSLAAAPLPDAVCSLFSAAPAFASAP